MSQSVKSIEASLGLYIVAIGKKRRAGARPTICPAYRVTQVKAVGSGYWRMIGSAEQLLEKAEAIGQRWLKGIAIARKIQKA